MKILTIDVGGTFIKYGIIDENLNITNKGRIETCRGSFDAYLNSLSSVYDKYKDEVCGVSCSMPGFIDAQKGYIAFGGALDEIVHNINIKQILSNRFGCPVYVANDADCAAMAELGYGSLKDVKDAVVYVIGTAIGGCLIADRKILQGHKYASGEFSFMQCDIDNPKKDNMLAYKCGSKALVDMVKEKLNILDNINGEDVFELISNDNQIAIQCLKDYTRRVAVSLLNIQCIFDPEKIAIGGGISKQSIMLDYLRKAIDEVEELNNNMMPRPTIVACQFDNDSNLIGAYYNYMINEKGD